MATSGLPFDDIRALLNAMPGPDMQAVAAVRARDSVLTKPPGALGRLEEIAEWLAAWTGRPPAVSRPLVAVFAGNHGVTAQGISAFPPEVTEQMVANFASGGAAINQLSDLAGAALDVVPLELDRPTADFTQSPAMTEDDLLAAGEGAELSAHRGQTAGERDDLAALEVALVPIGEGFHDRHRSHRRVAQLQPALIDVLAGFRNLGRLPGIRDDEA